MRADPFVPVYKGMVFYQTKTKMSCLLLERWIDIFSAKGLKRSIQRRVQHSFIAQAR